MIGWFKALEQELDLVLLESSPGFHSLCTFRRVAVGLALFQLGLSVARRGDSHPFVTELVVGLQKS